MSGSLGSGESTVLVEREAYRELLRASRRNVHLAYAAGGLTTWAAIVLGITAGAVTLWVVLFAIAGVTFLAWGVRTSRRLTRQYGPPGVPPTGGPFAPIPYVDRQHSMWRESVGVVGNGGDTGGDVPTS